MTDGALPGERMLWVLSMTQRLFSLAELSSRLNVPDEGYSSTSVSAPTMAIAAVKLFTVSGVSTQSMMVCVAS